MTKNLRGQHVEIERQALAQLRERTKLEDIQISAVRSAELHERTIYQVAGQSALEPNADLVIFLDESGRELKVSFDDLVERLGRIPFDLLSDYGESTAPLRIGGGRDVQIMPDQNQLVLTEGETKGPERIAVTISAGELKLKLDVYFLCDTTGSMGRALPSLKTAANMVIDRLVAGGADSAFGAGSYKDFFGGGAPFSNDARINTNPDDARNAIGAWTASGGMDLAEAQLFAMDQVAEPPLGPIGWREDAKHILVWFGDEPGHDPICRSISGLPYVIDAQRVLDQLNEHDIIVIAVDTGTGQNGLDGDPSMAAADYANAGCAPGGRSGQADDFSFYTRGVFIETPSGGDISVDDIVAGINGVLDALAPEVPAAQVIAIGEARQFVAQISKVEHGPWQTRESITFDFDVTFFGTVACALDGDQVFEGRIQIWIGDQLAAEKTLQVTVPRCLPTIVDDPVAIAHHDKTTDNIGLGAFVRGEHHTLLSCFWHPSVNNFVWKSHDTSQLQAGEVIEEMAVTSLSTDTRRDNEVHLFYVVSNGQDRRLLLMAGSPRLENWNTTQEFLNAELRGRSPLIGAGRIREHRRPRGGDRLFPAEDTVYVAMVGTDQHLYTRPYGYRSHPSFTSQGTPADSLLSDARNPAVAYRGVGPDFFALNEHSRLFVNAAQHGYFPHGNMWHDLGKANPDGIVAQGPAVATENMPHHILQRLGRVNRHFTFVTYAQFGVAVNIWDGDLSNTGAWELLGTPGGRTVQDVGRYGISAVIFPRRKVFETESDAKAFVFVNVAGELFFCSGDNVGGAWQWTSLGAPPGRFALEGRPDATVWEEKQERRNEEGQPVLDDEGKPIVDDVPVIYSFVRGVDRRGHGHLFVCKVDLNGTGTWIDVTATGVPVP